jgi:type VI secretion system secreted protein VgrG
VSTIGFVPDRYPVQFAIPSLSDAPLLVQEMDGEELISGLFTFHVRMLSEKSDLAFDSIIGKDASLSIGLPDGSKQYVHAIVGRFRQAGTTLRFTTYFAELYPRMWLLTKTRDCRIFQNKTAPEIVKQVLGDHGVTSINDTLTGTYDPREYCVQYRETAFDFVSRLMEAEGISYYFEHSDSAHTLVLADDASSYQTGPGSLTIAATEMSSARSDALPECSIEVQVTSDQCKLDDYNFETPSTDLLGTASGDTTNYSVYDYPAGPTTKSAVEALATKRVEELELPRLVLHGNTSNAAVRPGHTLTLTDHPRASANVKYVAWKVRHQATQDTYSNAFDAFPADTPFRPALVTPVPRIDGCQTALVVGKSGEEITTDQYGRIKVKFHWDRAEASDDTCSCWIRVAQPWAGKAYGAFFLPRIGQEVVVTFLEGDPDRPLITGSVYNAKQTVPYALPDNQTRTIIKSDSSKGSGGSNEICFEDKKGEEDFYIHAQKDLHLTVLNDETTTITKNRSVTIKEADDTLTVSQGKRTVTIQADETHENKAKLTYNVTSDLALTVGGKLTVSVTGDLTLKVSGAVKITGDSDVNVSAMGAMTQKSTGAMTTESQQNMTIKAGINLNQEAGAAFKAKANATANVEAGAILVLKGALVKIN